METDFTREKVIKLADLLMIGLSDEETEMVLSEFEIIDKNINKINAIPNLDNVSPMTHCLDDFSVSLREDVVKETPTIEELLQNAGDTMDREVAVAKVVE